MNADRPATQVELREGGAEHADHAWQPVQTIEGIVCRYCKGPETSPRHYGAEHAKDKP